MLNAGDLDKRVSIQRLAPNSPDRDQGGAPDSSWVTVDTVWAGIMPLRGRELIAAQEVHSEVSGTIKIRYRASLALTAADRVVYAGRNYDILAVVDPREEHTEWLLYVREGPNDG